MRIVGVDEAGSTRGDVRLISPVARALMKADVGDEVTLQTPSDTRRVEVVKIPYKET